MNQILLGALVGCGVGAVGTGLGAAISFFVKRSDRKIPAITMGISGGLVLAIVFFDMAPESVEMAGWGAAVIGAAIGAVFACLMHLLLPHMHVRHDHTCRAKQPKNPTIATMGILLCMGVAIHNFPEGLAMGSGLAGMPEFGIGLAVLLLVHNIPEGLALAMPFRISGYKNGRILLLAIAAGLPMMIGAVLGAWLGSGISPQMIGAIIAFGAGAMLFVMLREVIPGCIRMNRSAVTWIAMILGLGIGTGLVFLV